jgi:hypothetical protein
MRKQRMRAVLVATVAAIAVALAPTAAAHADTPATAAPSESFVGTFYICDGGGAGFCKSLVPHATPFDLESVFAVPMNGGAWRWDLYDVGTVNSGTFTDHYIDTALAGLAIYNFALHADPAFCNGNSDGGDVIKFCSSAASEEWVFEPTHGFLVNVGRSNDKDNWEVLCNPGGGGQLVIGTRDSCTTYHRDWAIV